MKKAIIIISIIAGIAVIAIILLLGNYKWKIAEMEEMRTLGIYEEWYSGFYDEYGEYPISLEQVMDSIKKSNQGVDPMEYIRQDEIDIFNKDKMPPMYVPLYNRNTNKIESFLLLSSGPDGRFNTVLTTSDTIHMDNWWEEIIVYNYFESTLEEDKSNKQLTLYNTVGPDWYKEYSVPTPAPLKFRLCYLWGKKDYVIQIGRRSIPVLWDTTRVCHHNLNETNQ